MKIVIGADHRGFALKERLKIWLETQRYGVEDVGAAIEDPDDDYPDFGFAVARTVANGGAERGIVLCGSGVGVAIAANRVRGVRAALTTNLKALRAARNDDDVNVLALPADFISDDEAKALIHEFLATPFKAADERFARRKTKLDSM